MSSVVFAPVGSVNNPVCQLSLVACTYAHIVWYAQAGDCLAIRAAGLSDGRYFLVNRTDAVYCYKGVAIFMYVCMYACMYGWKHECM